MTRPPSVGGPAQAENRAGEAYVEQLEALGARVVEATIPDPPDDTWPLFFHEAAEAHRATFPARADEYGAERPHQARAGTGGRPGRGRTRAAAVRAWRTYRPEVDLYVAPVLGVEVPPVDCDELDIRIPATAFLRPFNVLGWAAIAIGDLQFDRASRRDGARRGARLGAAAYDGLMSLIFARRGQRSGRPSCRSSQ